MVRVKIEDAEKFSNQVLGHYGVPTDQAEIITEVIVPAAETKAVPAAPVLFSWEINLTYFWNEKSEAVGETSLTSSYGSKKGLNLST